MAEPVLLSNLLAYLGGYDFGGDGNITSVNLTLAKAELANSRFNKDNGETFHPGIQQVTAELGGFFASSVATDPDPVIFTRIDPTLTSTSWPLLLVPPFSPAATPDTFGNHGYLIVGKQFTYNFGGTHGELMTFNLGTKLGTTFAATRNRIMATKTAVSGTTTGTGLQLGALAATDRMVVSFHVFLISGTGSWTLTIESDDNSGFTSATVRDTFTVVDETDDPTNEVRAIAGAVTDDWWRAVLTETSGTSTITYAVSMGIDVT